MSESIKFEFMLDVIRYQVSGALWLQCSLAARQQCPYGMFSRRQICIQYEQSCTYPVHPQLQEGRFMLGGHI